MDSEQKKSEERNQLNRQHRNEWNSSLALETEVRFALYMKHEQERTRVYDEEINFHQRATLATHQLQEITALKHQDREKRIAILKRHTQEHVALNQRPG